MMTAESGGQPVEMELKIQLDPEGEARLRKEVAKSAALAGPARTQQLLSIYMDTESGALAKAGIALRLRKNGKRWLQSAKRRPEATSRGFFAASEAEAPAPRGRLRLDLAEPTGLFREIGAIANGDALAPVFETRVKRTVARLSTGRGLVELAIDRGEVIAGALSAPVREAELELVEGEVGAIFDVARSLFGEGPIVFSTEPKSARGLRLARTGQADAPLGPRKAGAIAFAESATAEQAAREVLRDCFGQIADNIVVTATSDDPEGPHQLRIGLRRLRTAFSAFRAALGTEALARLGEEAKRLGRVVGDLRDLDVLIDEMVPGAAAHGLADDAREALLGSLKAQRRSIRTRVRKALSEPEAARFVFDLAELIEGRGWLTPSDYSQTERLAEPFAEYAPRVLDKRHRKVVKRGRRLDELDAEGLHELRKELKKLRYTAELCAPLYDAKAQKRFVKALKALQDTFGAINDAATTREQLAPQETGTRDPAAERAAGWVLGVLALEAEAARRELDAGWRAFAKEGAYWR